MSHFLVGVITDNPEKLESILAPYYEELEMPRYVAKTKEQLISVGRARFAEEITSRNNNPEHLEYLKKEIPLRVRWTDEEWYQHLIRFIDKENIGLDGEIYDTRNPKGKWDYYTSGGRWSGVIRKTNDEKCDFCKIKHIDNIDLMVYACVTPDGEWHESGTMGWFGLGSDTEDSRAKFGEFFTATLKSADPEHYLIIVDCHI